MTERPPRRAFLGLSYETLTLAQISDTLAERAPTQPFAFLVTPNVDHVVRLQEASADGAQIAAAYHNAEWCACDSRILAALAGMQGIALPVAPGSDLTNDLLARVVRSGDRIALIGGAASTAAALRARLPGVEIVEHQPPMGLRSNAPAIAEAARFITETRARFTFIAVGSPQQELVAEAARQRGDGVGIGLCIGSAIEFVVGEKRRAPLLVQRLHLEWAFRLAGDPRRLWKRYLVDGPRIFGLALAEARRHRRAQ